jgi:hypothetical protein
VHRYPKPRSGKLNSSKEIVIQTYIIKAEKPEVLFFDLVTNVHP